MLLDLENENIFSYTFIQIPELALVGHMMLDYTIPGIVCLIGSANAVYIIDYTNRYSPYLLQSYYLNESQYFVSAIQVDQSDKFIYYMGTNNNSLGNSATLILFEKYHSTSQNQFYCFKIASNKTVFFDLNRQQDNILITVIFLEKNFSWQNFDMCHGIF